MYSKAISLDPTYFTAINNRGATYIENNALKLAQADFESVLKKDPFNSFAYNNLASIAIKEKDFKKAKELTSKAIQLNAKNGPAYYNRGIALQMLHEEDACCADWKKAVELGVENAQTFINVSCQN